jgi:hypothetical protein
MKREILLFVILFFNVLIFSNAKDDKIIEPTGKLKFLTLTKCEDEKQVKFSLYKNTFLGSISPSFLDLFCNNKENIILFSKYHENYMIFSLMLNLGIDFFVLGLGTFLGSVPFLFTLYQVESSIIVFSILTVFTGILLITGIIFMAIMGVYYKKTKTLFKSMIENYNNALDEKEKVGLVEINLFKVQI